MRNRMGITLFMLLLTGAAICPADDGLVGYWRFDTAASSVADLTGHGPAAQVSGGKVIIHEGKKVLALDNGQKIVIPSRPEFNLRAGFSIEMRIKFSTPSGDRDIVRKDKQYWLRVDQVGEKSQLLFFPYVNDVWEPRATALDPTLGEWHHLAATWDGRQTLLWVDGLPSWAPRGGKPPTPNDSSLVVACSPSHGKGAGGAIEYLKIYRRALSPQEVLTAVYGRSPSDKARSAAASFDFTAGAGKEGWTAKNGATVAVADRQLVIGVADSHSLVINDQLGDDVENKDFISLRMSVAKGGQARLIFATAKGVGSIPFQTIAGPQPHNYVFEAWNQPEWGGKLLTLALIPSDIAGDTARIEYLRVAKEPAAAPEIQVERIFTESTLPRAQRTEQIVVRLLNTAGPARNFTATLSAPEGVVLKTAASQTAVALEHLDHSRLVWDVEAQRPVAGLFRVTVAAEGMSEPVSAEQTVTFHADPHLEKASYVPVPIPAKTKYALWTHYCALWKYGTHQGWKAIEPWPERKPVLGWYDEGTPEVADWHIKYMVEHGVSGIVYCWYRSSINGPVTQSLGHALDDGLLKARYLSMIKFGLMWENGCALGVGSVDDLMKNVLPFWIDNYFSNPSYIRVDGKPLLYVWVPSNLRRQLGGSENVRKALDQMRAECKRRGLGGLFLVGCAQSQDKAALETLAKEGWDATSCYGNTWRQPEKVAYWQPEKVGKISKYAYAPFEGFVDQQESLWKFKRGLHLLPDVPVAMMGWDSRPWQSHPFFWSDNTPEKFRDLCSRLKAMLDASPDSDVVKNKAIFCCWNEFGEGHYIEPTRGKGFTYLDAIRDVFCEGPKEHVDIAPEDVGRGPLDSWYRTGKEKEHARNPGGLHARAWSGESLAAWTGRMGFGPADVRDGALCATSTTRDPAFFSPAIELRASRSTKVVVEMRISRPAGFAQLFWATATAPTSEAASVRLPTIADGQWHSYTFAVGQNANWGGCITSLRFDPVDAEGVTVEIKSIRIE